MHDELSMRDLAWEQVRAKGQDLDAVIRYAISSFAMIDDPKARVAALSYFCIVLDNEIVKLKQAPGYEDLWKVS